MIRLEALTKVFPSSHAGAASVNHVSFDVADGETCVLLGPSGCGKTTTLRMINRLVTPTSGKVFIAGRDTDVIDPVELRRTIGYVIQQIGLFPNMTVEENICVVPKLLGNRAERPLKVILDGEHVASELRGRIVRSMLLFRFQPAAHVLDFRGSVKRLAVRFLQGRLELRNAVVLGDFGRTFSGFAADFLRFFSKLVVVLVHAISLVRAFAVKSTIGMTRA